MSICNKTHERPLKGGCPRCRLDAAMLKIDRATKLALALAACKNDRQCEGCRGLAKSLARVLGATP